MSRMSKQTDKIRVDRKSISVWRRKSWGEKNETRHGGRAWLGVFTYSGGSFTPWQTLCRLVAVPPSVQPPRSRLGCVYQRCRLAIWVPLAGATHKSALQLLHRSLGAHLQCWRCSRIDAEGCDGQLVPAKPWGQLMNLACNQRTVIYFSSPGQMPEWTDRRIAVLQDERLSGFRWWTFPDWSGIRCQAFPLPACDATWRSKRAIWKRQ